MAFFALGIPLLLCVVVAGMYNGLVAKENGVANAFASLDASLQKRHDLVPNLVAAVQGYLAHERDLLVRVVQLRGVASSPQARLQSDAPMTQAVAQIMALAESYPALQASANFLHLQSSLNEIEEQISASRRAFNAAVTDLNNAVEMFPTSAMASTMGMTKKDWFQTADARRENPDFAGEFN